MCVYARVGLSFVVFFKDILKVGLGCIFNVTVPPVGLSGEFSLWFFGCFKSNPLQAGTCCDGRVGVEDRFEPGRGK